MRIIVLSVLLLISGLSLAHDHNLSSYTIYQVKGVWMLKVDCPTSSLVDALRQEEQPFDISDANTKQAVVEYLKKNMDFKMDGKVAIEMGAGGIKLGGHVSEVIFILRNFSEDWLSLQCHISCFSSNKEQSNLIRVQLGENKGFKEFLSSHNQFKTVFEQVSLQSGG